MSIKSTLEVPAMITEPTAGHRARRRSWHRVSSILIPLVGAVIVLAIWQFIVVMFAVPEYLIPAPTAVGHALVSDFPLLVQNMWPTLIESVVGFLLGNAIAVALAIVFVHNATLERTFYPMAVVVRTVPIVAIAPVLVLLLGQGYAPKIAIAALISFFPTLVNMVRGLGSIDPQIMELMRVLSANKREIFLKVRLISSLPYLFASLKIATGAAVIGAVVAEWIGSDTGLGVLIINATYQYLTPLLYATMAVASAMALAFFGVIVILERVIIRWETKETTT